MLVSNGNIKTAFITHQTAGQRVWYCHNSTFQWQRRQQQRCSMTACRGAALQATSSDIKHRMQCFAKRRGRSCHFHAPELWTRLHRLYIDHIVEKCFVFFQCDKGSLGKKKTFRVEFVLVSFFFLVICYLSVLFLLREGPSVHSTI